MGGDRVGVHAGIAPTVLDHTQLAAVQPAHLPITQFARSHQHHQPMQIEKSQMSIYCP